MATKLLKIEGGRRPYIFVESTTMPENHPRRNHCEYVYDPEILKRLRAEMKPGDWIETTRIKAPDRHRPGPIVTDFRKVAAPA